MAELKTPHGLIVGLIIQEPEPVVESKPVEPEKIVPEEIPRRGRKKRS